MPNDVMEYVLAIFWDDLENNLVYDHIEKQYGITFSDDFFSELENYTFLEFLHGIEDMTTGNVRLKNSVATVEEHHL